MATEDRPLDGVASAYIQKANNGHYYLWVLFDFRGLGPNFCGEVYRLDLGTCPPECSQWDCLSVPHVANVPCPGQEPSEGPFALVTVSSGSLCCYYSDDPACCPDRDPETFPATVSATVIKNGVTLYDDVLAQEFAADGYLYQDHDGETLVAAFGCSCPEPPCAADTAFFNLLGVIHRNLAVLSCDPLHAYATFTDASGNVWEIEVME